MLLELATAADLFHTAGGTAFADLPIDGHQETWPLRSPRFRAWLRRLYYKATGEALSAATLNSALNLLEARAQFDGPERTVHVLVAEHAGRLYLDLADPGWRAVEIGPKDWRIVAKPPVRFRRPPGVLPLPVPQPGGSIEQLASFLNLPEPGDLILVASWLLAALRPRGPYPLLVVAGEQGSAKTVLSKMLRALIDPNVAPVRTLPREERDLFIAANNGHVLAFDNLSALAPWLSDALCRLASGGSFAVRQLYTDQDEVLFDAARPIILNGIEDVASRPDLADRALFLTLPYLSEARRRPEQTLWQEFELVRPRLLGALLDAVSHGLRALPQVRLDRLPRMADFARWAEACESALWPAGAFASAYVANRRGAVADAVDADPVAACVRELMAECSSWAGSAADLLRAIADHSRDGIGRETGWPQNPRALAGRLRRAQTFLRALGIEIAFSREGHAGSRIIRIHASSGDTVSTVSVGNGTEAQFFASHYREGRLYPIADGADAKSPATTMFPAGTSS
jgi:hypothetical protein